MDQVEHRDHGSCTDQPDLILFFQTSGDPSVRVVRDVGDHRSGDDAISPVPSRLGSVGKALPGVEVELAEDDELLMRGGVITEGYYKLPDDTTEAFDSQGWLHSGDLGRIDDDGFVWIVGRKKEIIITAAGKEHRPGQAGDPPGQPRSHLQGVHGRRRSQVPDDDRCPRP